MRLAALASALVLAFDAPVLAQPYETPEDLLEAFYEPYFTDEFFEDESQFRSRALQALYDRDAEITPDGEMGAISFDPYIDGQDYEITEFEIGTPQVDGDAAIVEVSFLNMGEPRLLTYELVLEDGGWKIDDVISANPENQYRLSEIFEEAAAAFQ